MPLFQYKAVSATGEVQEGVLDGPSQSAIIERLQSSGLIPIRADETSQTTSKGSSGGAGKSFLARLIEPKKVTQNNLTVFTREIATLLKAGLPLDRSMEILLNLAENDRVRDLIANIRNEVRGGAALSKALDQNRDVFTRFYVNMVRAGEAGGALPDVLKRLAEHMERAKELKDSVTSALFYPVLLMLVAGVSVGVLVVFVVPTFKQIFDQSGKALPFVTQVVMWVSAFLRGYWPLLLAGLIVGAYWLSNSLSNPVSRKRWDQRFLENAVFGDLVAKVEMARFSRTLSTLVSNGVPLLTALSIVKETMGNMMMSEAVGAAAAELKEGRGLAKPMLETNRFPKLAVQMIAVGEETGRLDEMLMQVADTYDMEVRFALKRLLTLVEPVMILGMAVVVGVIIMSLLVAMLDLFTLPL
ncbi:MAG: type II secretion system F family protein [Betaproteobacteria bacterium]|nr:type II secretion system F family protein [Betaproteobacteria bacterium]